MAVPEVFQLLIFASVCYWKTSHGLNTCMTEYDKEVNNVQ